MTGRELRREPGRELRSRSVASRSPSRRGRPREDRPPPCWDHEGYSLTYTSTYSLTYTLGVPNPSSAAMRDRPGNLFEDVLGHRWDHPPGTRSGVPNPSRSSAWSWSQTSFLTSLLDPGDLLSRWPCPPRVTPSPCATGGLASRIGQLRAWRAFLAWRPACAASRPPKAALRPLLPPAPVLLARAPPAPCRPAASPRPPRGLPLRVPHVSPGCSSPGPLRVPTSRKVLNTIASPSGACTGKPAGR